MIEEIEDTYTYGRVQVLFADVQANWARDLEVKGGNAWEGHHIDWQIRATLRVASAFETDVSVGLAKYSRNERKRVFKALVHIGSFTESLRRYGFRRRRVGGLILIDSDDQGIGD